VGAFSPMPPANTSVSSPPKAAAKAAISGKSVVLVIVLFIQPPSKPSAIFGSSLLDPDDHLLLGE